MNEIVATEQQPEPSSGATMLAIIDRAARDPNTDMDKLERLLALKERLDAKDAEGEFFQAMQRAQSKMRTIGTDANNPQTRSKYATYAKLDSKLRPIYTEEGFSLSFDTDDSPKPDHIRVLCYVAHRGGHMRTYKADMPSDGKGAKGGDVMTKTHAFGAGSSYGMRYLLKMIFNVAVGEDDADGNDPDPRVLEAAAKANEWAESATSAGTLAELAARKADCLKSYGMVDKVPTVVRAAFVKRQAELEPANTEAGK